MEATVSYLLKLYIYIYIYIYIYQFKAKDSEIKTYPLCLGNISKDFTINNTKKTD